MDVKFSIGYTSSTLSPRAIQLATKLNCSIDNDAPNRLIVTPDGLMIESQGFKPLMIDFSKKCWQHRRAQGKSQAIIKACKPSLSMYIIDATAGWGRDAAILASFGARVAMIERNPIMACLLEDALQRQDNLSKKALNLSLIQRNAIDYLEQLTELPDIIYLDPMHPTREKSSLVKKDLQILQSLIGFEADLFALFEISLQRARSKVIVKWPSSQNPLTKPHFTVPGKTVRYDVYIAQNH